MIIKISNGELVLKKLNRKLRKKLRKLAVKDIGLDLQTQKLDKLMAPSLEDFSEEALKLLTEKVTINGKEYEGARIEQLNDDGIFTDDDWELCEKLASEMFVNDKLKKKSMSLEQSSSADIQSKVKS